MYIRTLLTRGGSFLHRTGASRVAVIFRPVSTSSWLQEEGYTSRNKSLNRPLSPSLAILAKNPDPVWILSFGHRASAAVLTPALSLISIEYLFSGKSFSELLTTFGGLASNPTMWFACKFMMALPFTYHCINGLRHLYWDTGSGFTMKFTVRAGYTVLVLAIISAYGLALYTPGK